jgi:hypothetical protein
MKVGDDGIATQLRLPPLSLANRVTIAAKVCLCNFWLKVWAKFWHSKIHLHISKVANFLS